MAEIKLSARVGEDRRLVVNLPPDTPTGPVELTIRSLAESAETPSALENPEREEIRAKLKEAGLLSTIRYAPEGAQPLSDEELAQIGRLPPGSRSSEELVAEDRGPY